MAILAQPNYIEFKLIPSMMVGVWLALFVALRALSGTNEFPSTNRVINGQSCSHVISIIFEICAAVLAPFVGFITKSFSRFGIFSFTLSGGPVSPLTNRISGMFATPFSSVFGYCHA
jgi:hypothetical protein